MHIVLNSTPIEYRQDGEPKTLPPGEWLCNDENAFHLAMMAERGSVTVSPYKEPEFSHVVYGKYPPDIKSILLIRSGAIGDLLLLSPCIKSLHEKYPNSKIHLSCFQKHHGILSSIPSLGIWEYPLPLAAAENFDIVISLESVPEIATDKHATDAFAYDLGIIVNDYKPVYRVTTEEKKCATATFPPIVRIAKEPVELKPRVSLQLRASSSIRDYPMQKWGEVIKDLIGKGWEVFLHGRKGQVPVLEGAPASLHDCSQYSFREAAAIISTCDAFCGVDSSFFNLCPALGVPAIGLFGPVDWKTRIKPGSGQTALSGVGECAPCGWTNSRGGIKFPSHGPCSKKGFCVPLSEIKPERIVAKIEKLRPCKSE